MRENICSRIWTTSTCWRSPTAVADSRLVGREIVLDGWDRTPVELLRHQDPGTPVGNDESVQRWSEERIEKEEHLWRAIAWVPGLQYAWQILLSCAGPRCHHYLRTLAPRQSAWCAGRHDEGMMDTMAQLQGGRLAMKPRRQMRRSSPRCPCVCEALV